MKNFINSITRFFMQLHRPSQKENLRLLKTRDETLTSIKIREAASDDIPKLAALHVKAWNETYNNVKNPPVYETRAWQWKQQFETNDESWFCYVIENSKAELIGFAKGAEYSHNDLPAYAGQLQQIYLLRIYQRMGIGKKLFCKVIEKFLSKGIHSMVLFGIPQNPSCYFHEAMGGKKLFAKNGEFHGGYGWMNLNEIKSLCK